MIDRFLIWMLYVRILGLLLYYGHLMSLESSMLAELKANIQAYPNIGRWVVAYSGGVDSTALLHLLFKVNQLLDKPLAIAALHINHQLSPSADDWYNHCKHAALNLGVEFFSERVAVDLTGQGVEAAARDARYAVFDAYLSENDRLLMGHHADDQAETVLLRLMRGAGVLGLSAMPAKRRLGQSYLLRPLLQTRRKILVDYVKLHGLSWIEDESNESDSFDRNYLRHNVLPLLESRWPQANKQLTKIAEYSQQAQSLLSDLAAIDLNTIDQKAERYGVSVDWKKLKALSAGRINNVMRYWCELQNVSAPDSQQLKQIHEQFFSTNAMLTSAVVDWASAPSGIESGERVELRQFNQRLYLMPALKPFDAPDSNNIHLQWDVKHNLDLGPAGQLHIDVALNGLQLTDTIWNRQIDISWRKGGERCTPAGRSSSQTVKKLLQEYQLETWLRDRVPLLYIDGQLAAVGDLWVCEDFVKSDNDSVFYMNWKLN